MAFSLLIIAAAQAAAQQPLNLTCVGGGTVNAGSVRVGRRVGLVRDFSDQVDVRLFGSDESIRLPDTMIGFHGGKDGWFRLKEVTADSRSIHAVAVVNFLDHPKVYIDRVTGTISIAGLGEQYSGQCQLIDSNTPAKF